MLTNLSELTSCLTSSFANILSSGPGAAGCPVFGSKGGGRGSGRSAWMLYQFRGISSGGRETRVSVAMSPHVRVYSFTQDFKPTCTNLYMRQNLVGGYPQETGRIPRTAPGGTDSGGERLMHHRQQGLLGSNLNSKHQNF